MERRRTRGWWMPEFFPVAGMLLAFVLLVGLVMWIPVEPFDKDVTTTFREVLEFRKIILVAIVTAFSAWVGAGAAYFFGRESLREASASLLAMRRPTPGGTLTLISVEDIPPRPLCWTVKKGDTVGTVMAGLQANPEYWFITVIRDSGRLETVIEEGALGWFVDQQFSGGAVAYATVTVKTVQEVLSAGPPSRHRDRYVLARLDSSVGEVYASMQERGVNLAVVVDEEEKPTHFFTTADVRRVLLRVI